MTPMSSDSVEDFCDCDNITLDSHMSPISTYCPRCQRPLEIPMDFDNVICPGCATAYWIRRHLGAINLSEMWPDTEDLQRRKNAAALIDSRLAEIDESMAEAESEIESLRSREQSAPLQKGCAFFGLFTMVIVVIALFMLLGKGYFGGWLFFAAVAAVILLSLARMRRKLVSSAHLEGLRRERMGIEDGLVQLRAERKRIERLRTSLSPEPTNK